MNEALERLIASEVRLSNVTSDGLERELQGFPLQSPRGFDWLARAIRGALYASLSDPHDRSRPTNADSRDELFGLAEKVSATWLALAERSQAADDAIFDYAWHGWKNPPPDQIAEPPDHAAFSGAVAQLDWLAVFLRRAGMLLEVQRPQWRRAEERSERILRAQYLSVVFEKAYPGKKATVSSSRLDGSLGAWADFYQAVVGLAFGERGTPNLSEVLKEARRRTRENGVRLEAGILPD
jgi:hypothetical protein